MREIKMQHNCNTKTIRQDKSFYCNLIVFCCTCANPINHSPTFLLRDTLRSYSQTQGSTQFGTT